MDNKKYLDKVLNYLVRGTKMNYEKERIYFSFSPSTLLPLLSLSPPYSPLLFRYSFSKYCKTQFGLTEEEIKYVWDQYTIIITDKINNGQ